MELKFKLGKCDQHQMRYFWKGFSLSSTVLAKQDTSGSGCWCGKRSLKFPIIFCNSTTVYCKNDILLKLYLLFFKKLLKAIHNTYREGAKEGIQLWLVG